MAQLITLYWRDIPAQVIAERGRGRKREQAKLELSRRFSIAIDEAAMRDGADSTDLRRVRSSRFNWMVIKIGAMTRLCSASCKKTPCSSNHAKRRERFISIPIRSLVSAGPSRCRRRP